MAVRETTISFSCGTPATTTTGSRSPGPIWISSRSRPIPSDARRPDPVQADTVKLAYYRTPARMRHDNPVFAHGRLETLYTDDANNTFGYVRYIDDVSAYVVFNRNSSRP